MGKDGAARPRGNEKLNRIRDSLRENQEYTIGGGGGRDIILTTDKIIEKIQNLKIILK